MASDAEARLRAAVREYLAAEEAWQRYALPLRRQERNRAMRALCAAAVAFVQEGETPEDRCAPLVEAMEAAVEEIMAGGASRSSLEAVRILEAAMARAHREGQG